MNTGIDESQVLTLKQVQDYAEVRAKHGGVQYHHTDPQEAKSEFGRDLLAKAVEQGIIPINITVTTHDILSALLEKDIIKYEHMHAGHYVLDLYKLAFTELDFPTRRNLKRKVDGEMRVDMDITTFYIRIFNGWRNKKLGINIPPMRKDYMTVIHAACLPQIGRNPIPWLMHCKKTVREAFDNLNIVFDKFKTIEDNATKNLGELRPKLTQPANEN